MTNLCTVPCTDERAAGAVEYLRASEDSCLFLLGNFKQYGPVLTEHQNSGDFQCVLRGDEIVGVFCLTRRGNLLLQTENDEDVLDKVADAALHATLPLSGIIGPWSLVEALVSRVTHAKHTSPSFHSREVLYSLPIAKYTFEGSSHTVRLLEEQHFAAYNNERADFLAGEGLPNNTSIEDARTNFLEKVKARCAWGAFDGDELVGTALLNTRYEHIGQVGGVYLRPSHRGRGLSKNLMHKLIVDCRDALRISKLVLFTGPNNRAAQGLYERIGFVRIGDFGMSFWN